MSRKAGSRIPLYGLTGTVIRYVTHAEADDLMKGHVAHANEVDGAIKSLRLLKKEAKRLPIATGLGLFELQANAGCWGEPSSFLGESDVVLQVRDKVLLWPFEHDRKAVYVAPRVSQRDVDLAVAALKRAGAKIELAEAA